MKTSSMNSTQTESAGQAIAHVRADASVQLLRTHLESVGRLAATFAAKFRLQKHGELIGLLHDLGKYSDEFQSYIKSATGLINQDEDEDFVDATGLKGKVDHSTSGAQFIWKELASKSQAHHATAQVMALCVASHHSGLIDCLTLNPGRPVEDGFSKRISKEHEKTHLHEVVSRMELSIRVRVEALLEDAELTNGFLLWLRNLHDKAAVW